MSLKGMGASDRLRVQMRQLESPGNETGIVAPTSDNFGISDALDRRAAITTVSKPDSTGRFGARPQLKAVDSRGFEMDLRPVADDVAGSRFPACVSIASTSVNRTDLADMVFKV